MSIHIITDSASDIVDDLEGVEVVPMTIAFGDKSYRDGVDLSHQRFYEMLIESNALPVTSQVTVYEWGKAFSSACEQGDEVVCVTLSSKLSGTYQSALLAAEECVGKVHVVDSLNAAVGERVLVELALRRANEGKSAQEIVAELERRRSDVKLIALLDTLEYLKRGGRIDALSAGVGSLLHVKPVVTVRNGEVVLLGKARGSKNGRNLLNEHVEAAGGIDISLPFTLGYTGLSRKLLDKYVQDSRAHWQAYTQDPSDLPTHSIGATIGTHVGPGAVALAFFGANE
ncbi:MAG: DegV family protein [Coriobacteriales bacterium]|nr:DegV family protein [Coriobacteriales bacterium]